MCPHWHVFTIWDNEVALALNQEGAWYFIIIILNENFFVLDCGLLPFCSLETEFSITSIKEPMNKNSSRFMIALFNLHVLWMNLWEFRTTGEGLGWPRTGKSLETLGLEPDIICLNSWKFPETQQSASEIIFQNQEKITLADKQSWQNKKIRSYSV